jgi:hypothetical protein
LYSEQEERIADQIRQLPGGLSLLSNRSTRGHIIPKIAYILPAPDAGRTERAHALLAAGQIGVPTQPEGTTRLVFACYSSQALQVETQPTQYTISIAFDGVATCTCPDFEQNGGACKHILAALLLLDSLRLRGIPIPSIPIPSSVTEAHALQTRTAIHRAKTAASEERPTVRAASAVADILREENTAVGAGEEEAAPEEDVDDSGSDIDTDMSSDSGDEDIEDLSSQRAPTNLAALGEQALARTIYELQDVAPRRGDLAEFMKRKSGPLSTNEHLVLAEGRGHLAALMAELDRLLFATPAPTNAAQPTQAPVPSLVPSTSQRQKRSRTELLPPSPERASKRQQSYSHH